MYLFSFKLIISALVCALLIPVAADAGSDLVTDRPDFTESPVVVPSGSVQLESGVTWSRSGDSVNTLSGLEALIRWSPFQRIELRFGLPDYISIDDDAIDAGFGDASIGTKVYLGSPFEGWDVGVIATTSLPTGDDQFTTDEADPDVILTAGGDIGHGWSLGTQVSSAWPTVGDDREQIWAATMVCGIPIGDATGVFVEVATEIPEAGEAPTVIHTGYTRQFGTGMQFDLHAGAGLNDSSPDFFFGAGFSARR